MYYKRKLVQVCIYSNPSLYSKSNPVVYLYHIIFKVKISILNMQTSSYYKKLDCQIYKEANVYSIINSVISKINI